MPEQITRTKTLPIAQATVIARLRFVSVNTSGQLTYPSAGASAVGISGHGSTNQQSAPLPVVALDGSIMSVEAGEAVSAGSVVSSNAAGQAIVTTAGARILGHALTAASALGEIIEIDTTPITAAGT